MVPRVLASRRYRHVDEALVARLVAEEAPKARNAADAEKRVKRRLHQIFGAYSGQPDYGRLSLALAAAWQGAPDEPFRAACRAALETHASTRERLPLLDTFYAQLWAVTGVPTRLVDIACGLNPLAAPWMELPDDAYYVAYDIDTALLGFVDGALDLLGVRRRVAARDIVADPPDDAGDVALLLKSVPCLDQQDPAAAARVLRALRTRHAVVTFPTRSLGGHGKGMAQTYRARFERLLDELGDTATVAAEIELEGELVYVLERGTGGDTT